MVNNRWHNNIRIVLYFSHVHDNNYYDIVLGQNLILFSIIGDFGWFQEATPTKATSYWNEQ